MQRLAGLVALPHLRKDNLDLAYFSPATLVLADIVVEGYFYAKHAQNIVAKKLLRDATLKEFAQVCCAVLATVAHKAECHNVNACVLLCAFSHRTASKTRTMSCGERKTSSTSRAIGCKRRHRQCGRRRQTSTKPRSAVTLARRLRIDITTR